MATNIIENMTLRELSDRVLETNGREDRVAEREHLRIVRETTARIVALTRQEPRVYSPPHPYKPYPNRTGCAVCPYPEVHAVHRGGA